jgi:cytochrome c-type biogenesis protein CcmH/NrfG
MAHRFLLKCLIVSVLTFLVATVTWAEHDQSETDSSHENQEESIVEMGEELAHAFFERLNRLLERELKRLRKEIPPSDEELRDQIKQYEAEIAKNPDIPESRFILGQIYDEMGDGASAIIQTKMAEDLYAREKNIKGIAECRRSLRKFYADYGYEPGDFILIR